MEGWLTAFSGIKKKEPNADEISTALLRLLLLHELSDTGRSLVPTGRHTKGFSIASSK
jgi:hypothetical protein